MKKHLMITAAILLFGLALAACGGASPPAAEPTPLPPTPEPAPAGDAARGQQLFAGTCTSCHGADATGIPGLGKDLTTSEWVGEQTDAVLLELLAGGRPASHELNTTGVDMPPKGGNPALSEQDLIDIVAYLRSIHK